MHKELVINAESNVNLSFNGCTPESPAGKASCAKSPGPWAPVRCAVSATTEPPGTKVEPSSSKATSILSRSLLKAWDRHTGS